MEAVVENNKRPSFLFRQSGVVPFRRQDAKIEVLLITSRRKKRWILPKGVVEKRMSPSASAAEEAWEEAGVKGSVSEVAIGSYDYQKWGGTCTVEIFPMEVLEFLDEWPDAGQRRREWVPIDDAICRVQKEGLKDVLRTFRDDSFLVKPVR